MKRKIAALVVALARSHARAERLARRVKRLERRARAAEAALVKVHTSTLATMEAQIRAERQRCESERRRRDEAEALYALAVERLAQKEVMARLQVVSERAKHELRQAKALCESGLLEGSAVRFARQALGLQQHELAGLLYGDNAVYGVVAQWEAGSVDAPQEARAGLVQLLDRVLAGEHVDDMLAKSNSGASNSANGGGASNRQNGEASCAAS